jgi:putative transcriptional regulator
VIDQKLNNQLRVARARVGVTQGDLAEAIGVTRKTVNSIENGRYVPSTRLALLLARELDATVEELFQLPDASREAGDAGGR